MERHLPPVPDGFFLKRPFCIRAVHSTGGGFTAFGKTIEEAKAEANKRYDKLPLKSYIASTLPFEATPIFDSIMGWTWTAAVPKETREDWGPSVEKLYSQSE